MDPVFSIVIPARNEENHLPVCLEALKKSLSLVDSSFEIIVVCNRCTDRTALIAENEGCRVVDNQDKNLSKIRNAGAALAKGKFIVTVDADSVVSEKMFANISSSMESTKHIGGGVVILPERWSLGIFITGLMLLPLALKHMISGGLFFTERKSFEEIGGFDPSLVSAEDIDFAKRLKEYGRTQGKKFKILKKAWIVTSCRKFDYYGDWYFVLRPWLMRDLLKNRSKAFADEFWYDFN